MNRIVVAMAALVLWMVPGCVPEGGGKRIGTAIPLAVNGIPGPGEKLSKYCSAYNPDPALHNHTIPELVAAERPFILIFGTPSHCTQCQNQIDTVRSYRDRYPGAFEVIHIDQYKNEAIYTALMVKGDPWTFFIDKNGVVQAVYPGVTTWSDVDGSIQRMLSAGEVTEA